RVDFLLGRRIDLDGGQDDFEFLHQDAFDFEELDFILGAELLAARQVGGAIKLLPALQIILHLGGQLIVFFGCAHNRQWLLGSNYNGTAGERNIMAPPRASRAVMCKLAKWMRNSLKDRCDFRASANRRRISSATS